MKTIERLASSLGRRDEIPNQELAKEIAATGNKSAVEELVENLNHKKKDVQQDCIKVLYEIGMLNPAFISAYHANFVQLLESKNNRLQWGAMMALNAITLEKPAIIFNNLSKLVAVAEKGTVITKDNLMAVLIKQCTIPAYSKDAFAVFNEQLMKSPANQLPMYAENAISIINEANKEQFIKTLNSRLGDIEKDTKRIRVEKVIKKLLK